MKTLYDRIVRYADATSGEYLFCFSCREVQAICPECGNEICVYCDRDCAECGLPIF